MFSGLRHEHGPGEVRSETRSSDDTEFPHILKVSDLLWADIAFSGDKLFPRLRDKE